MYAHRKGDGSNLETGIYNLRTNHNSKDGLECSWKTNQNYTMFQDTVLMAK